MYVRKNHTGVFLYFDSMLRKGCFKITRDGVMP